MNLNFTLNKNKRFEENIKKLTKLPFEPVNRKY